MFLLVDCNNFYVSCERLFRPDLRARPVVVLSNNDGCVVARSEEVKALGIPMGEPYFRCRGLLSRHGAAVFSSNYALYGDISSRVMRLLESWFARTEVYSIDEAFVKLSGSGCLGELGAALRARLGRWTGIPVSVGIAPTKTLAKLANRLGKRRTGVWVLLDEGGVREALERTPPSDIWGIGPRYAAKLARHGIRDAWALTQQRDAWLQKAMTIQGLRVVHELRGERCFELEEQPLPRKSMVHSRTFGRSISRLDELCGAISAFAGRLSAKLHGHGLVAQHLQVFLYGPRGDDGSLPHASSRTATLPEPTHYTPHITAMARRILKAVYVEGVEYVKGGVMVTGLQPAAHKQLSLWHEAHRDARQDELMQLVHDTQRKHGRRALRFASELQPPHTRRPAWELRREMCSPAYTTRWEELLCIQLDTDQGSEIGHL